MNKIIVPLLIIAAVAASVYFFAFKGASDPLSEGLKLEVSGTYSSAMPLYVKALLEQTDFKPLPTKSQAMTLAPAAWVKELDGYLSWLITPKLSSSASLCTAIEAIDRCFKHVENCNTAAEAPVKKALLGDYQKLWNAMFYPEGKIPPEKQELVIESAIDTGISIITFFGNASYSYEGSLINRATGKRSDFIVYTEGQCSLLAPAGNYELIVTGKAKFGSGQMWISPVSVLQMTVPDSASLVSITFKTDVKRRT